MGTDIYYLQSCIFLWNISLVENVTGMHSENKVLVVK